MVNALNVLFEKAEKEDKAIQFSLINGETIIIEPNEEYSFINGNVLLINEEILISLSFTVLGRLIPNKEERMKEEKLLLESIRRELYE